MSNPEFMCEHCGTDYDYNPDCCRVFGCFGHMVPFDAEKQVTLVMAHAPVQAAREALRPQIREEIQQVMRGEKPPEWLFRDR